MKNKTILVLVLFLINLTGYANQEPAEPHSILHSIWGKPTPRTLLLGMWTTHLWTNEFGALQANNLIGFSGYGLFAGTLTNSYEHRSYAGGIERYWWSKKLSINTSLDLGYRLGLIYGYQKGEVLFSDSSSVIPFIQLVSNLSYKRMGFELSTTGQVISGGFYLRF